MRLLLRSLLLIILLLVAALLFITTTETGLRFAWDRICLLYTSDAADDSVYV